MPTGTGEHEMPPRARESAQRSGSVAFPGVRQEDRASRLPSPESERVAHSHSMVPGGLLVTSRTTLLTSGTSLVMRVEIAASTS